MSVEKRPNGRWRSRYRDAAGKEHARHFDRKVDAVAWETAQKVAVQQGTHVDPSAGRETVRDFAERWRLDQVQQRPSTARAVERIFRIHVYPTIGDRRMSAVNRSVIQTLVTSWSADAAPRTVGSRFAHLRAMFSSAVDDGAIGKTPCVRIRVPEVIREKIMPLSVAQVRAIRFAIAEPYKPAVCLGAGCGVRVSEALAVQPATVRFLEREIDVHEQLSEAPPWELIPVKTKHGVRTIPAPDFTIDSLAPLQPGALLGTLITRPGSETGEPISARMVAQAFAGAVELVNLRAERRRRDRKAGRTALPELPTVPSGTTFHDLRHHYASLLIEGGESVVAVAALLGNLPAETLRTYAHLWPNTADRTRRIVGDAWSLEDHEDGMRTAEGG